MLPVQLLIFIFCFYRSRVTSLRAKY